MPKHDDISPTDTSEIEALMARRDQVKQLSYRLTLKLHFKVESTEYHNETKDEGP